MVQVTTRKSASGSAPPVPLRAFASGVGVSPGGHEISVNRDIPVEVVNAMNSRPSAPSESKSMISLSKSSGVAVLFAARYAERRGRSGSLDRVGTDIPLGPFSIYCHCSVTSRGTWRL
jgi:hypothetical protein